MSTTTVLHVQPAIPRGLLNRYEIDALRALGFMSPDFDAPLVRLHWSDANNTRISVDSPAQSLRGLETAYPKAIRPRWAQALHNELWAAWRQAWPGERVEVSGIDKHLSPTDGAIEILQGALRKPENVAVEVASFRITGGRFDPDAESGPRIDGIDIEVFRNFVIDPRGRLDTEYAFRAAQRLVDAGDDGYERGGHMEWDDVDAATELAHKAVESRFDAGPAARRAQRMLAELYAQGGTDSVIVERLKAYDDSVAGQGALDALAAVLRKHSADEIHHDLRTEIDDVIADADPLDEARADDRSPTLGG